MSDRRIENANRPVEISRRNFLVSAAGGLALGFFLPGLPGMSEAEAAVGGTSVNTWLRIGSDESITLTIGSSEMGQGSFTGLAQVLAEDLMVDFSKVLTVQGGPTLATPAPIGAAINTVGSSVTRTNYWKLRDAAAAAREMLVQAAMNSIGDPTRANYSVAGGIVTYVPTGATKTYGSLAAAAALLPVPVGAALVPDSQFKVIGKTQPRFDIPLKVDGSAKYGIDIRLPNMLYGVIKHCPTLGGTLGSTFAPPVAPSTVVGRSIFYNNSSFDGNSAAAAASDDNAIAPDKAALLPGQSATFANYTSYDKGINGVMVDIAMLPPTVTLTSSDFALLAGNTATISTWTTVPAIKSVSIRRGAGVGGSDRVTLLFADGSILNKWLRVTVKAGSRTALLANDVFYFGNLVGDTDGNGSVSLADVNNAKALVGQAATLTNVADFSRIGSVTSASVNIATANSGHMLPMISAPAAAPAAPSGKIAVIPTKVIAGTNRGLEATGNVNAVVVVGTNTWDTWQAARSLSVVWNLPANATLLNDAQFLSDAQALAANATPYVVGGANPPGTLYTVEGNAAAANAAIAQGATIVDAAYALPYVSHACMEVLNCTVDYVAGVKCDVYAPTQSAKSVLSLVASMTGLSASQINVHTTYLGGGLGRKAELDFVSQAVQAGMALGRPIKLMWPREEDFTHDQYRPMGYMHARAGLDANGGVVGWSYRNVSPSILAQRGVVLGALGDSQGIEGAQNLPYNLGARVTEYVTHPSPIPVGFWRSVGASLNTFGVESMIDELAAAAGTDPYQFRRKLLSNPRWIAVLDAAASLGNWATAPAAGHARGIAIGTAFNSIVAQVVEISAVTTTSLRVNTVSLAIDCYLVVNPGQVQTQLIGGVVHGMNAALYGRQSFVNGAAQAKNFSNSRMIRMGEMPQVNVTIIPSPAASDRTQSIGGVGELGVPTFAPALANAYFKLTGTRIRSLPIFPNAVMGDL